MPLDQSKNVLAMAPGTAEQGWEKQRHKRNESGHT
jgi:hypothetical protein